MPTYEYECTVCGYAFEVFQRMTDNPLKKCPKCKKKVRRLIGPGAGIIFKKGPSDSRKGITITRQRRVKIKDYLREQALSKKRSSELKERTIDQIRKIR